MKHLEANNVLADQLFGFRKRRSYDSQLVTNINDLATGLDEKLQIGALTLGFSQAFDKQDFPSQTCHNTTSLWCERGTR
jgi:hypothetical protein